MWLLDIRVREDVRRRGVGASLLGHLQQVAGRQRLRGILVETQSNNFPAVRFYQKQGFELVGFNDHLYTNDDTGRDDVALFLFWETRTE